MLFYFSDSGAHLLLPVCEHISTPGIRFYSLNPAGGEGGGDMSMSGGADRRIMAIFTPSYSLSAFKQSQAVIWSNVLSMGVQSGK